MCSTFCTLECGDLRDSGPARGSPAQTPLLTQGLLLSEEAMLITVHVSKTRTSH